jgi:hypothetical protein
MTKSVAFVLKPTSKHYHMPWSDDDYVVLNDGQVVGRIMTHPQAPDGQPWFWSITAREKPPSIQNGGYSATREQAMADFKARWQTGLRTS